MDLEEFAKLDQSAIKSTGYVVDTFEAAIWSLITTDNYRDEENGNSYIYRPIIKMEIKSCHSK